MTFSAAAREEFGISAITSPAMEEHISRWDRIYKGVPDWVNADDGIKTINFAKAICSETARLTMLGAKISISGSSRADWLMEQINKLYFDIRQWTEYGCNYGTILLKPGDSGVDVYTPEEFIVTDVNAGAITGAAFINKQEDEAAKKWYTRLEYHRFEDIGGVRHYVITNRCFVGNSANDRGKPIAIEKTPWVGLAEEVNILGLERPLFAVFKTPAANNVEIGSVLGMAIYAEAIEELRDLDVAYSRNTEEIGDSKRTILLDSDRLLPNGAVKGMAARDNALGFAGSPLPKYIKLVDGSGAADSDVYHEINPTLNTDTRLSGINALLSQIGYKVGFSNGYFVFNEQTGIQTATGVEAEQQRTIQFIKDVRDMLEKCLDGLVYAFDRFADLYDLAPIGEYELAYNFGDITYNREEDKQTWRGYVTQHIVPAWLYLTKFEGYTEEDAKAIVAEAQPRETLFGQEE